MARVSNWCGGRGRRRERDRWMEGICWEQRQTGRWNWKQMAELAPVVHWNLFGAVFHMSFFSFVLRVMPKNDTQVLTLCNHAFLELCAHNGMPHPYKTPLKSFHSVSPSLCKQTEGAFSTGESVVKALICGPHAEQQPAGPKDRASTRRFGQLPLGVITATQFTFNLLAHLCF